MTKILFIVGRGRSGTTLLARMLTHHPRIAVAPEGFFAMSLERKYRWGPWNARRIAAFCRDLVRERRMQTWDLDVPRLTQRLLELLQERKARLGYGDVCREVYRSFAEDTQRRKSVAWVGDKNPHYALLIERIDRLFPDARYLHITRDYRDNILSYSQMRFERGTPSALAQRWKRYNQEILKVSRTAPERFLWLRYEDLVERPESELRRICRFLDVEFDAHMLVFHAEQDPDPSIRRGKWFRGVQRPVDPRQAQKWPARLSETTVRRVESICGEFAERFGYHATTDGEQPLSIAARLGALYGSSTVLIEKLLFGSLPPRLRIGVINGYRRLAGRA
jgi:hypothetical protein